MPDQSAESEPIRTDWLWYHSTIGTYGSWLPGDPRGFRARHHREHVEGDYHRPPPPGHYEGLFTATRNKMCRSATTLSTAQRRIVGEALLGKLVNLGAIVTTVAVAEQHVHLLAKMPPDASRDWIGKAKINAWYRLRDAGCNTKLWAKRGRNEIIRSREHQLRVHRYILRHAEVEAWVWKWGDAMPEQRLG